jgi:type IV pilus assembly protein PilA
MKISQGFTLMELMIVIAIIGILAAIAMPNYQNYMIRAKVTEGLQLASTAKTAVLETYQSVGVFPANNAEAGLPEAKFITGNHVGSVAVDNGQIIITYKNGPIANKTIILVPLVSENKEEMSGSINWSCTEGSISPQYRPSQCRK